MKQCIKCKETKPFKDFFKDRRLKDGYMGRCKLCAKLWVASPEVKKRRNRQCKESIQKAKKQLTDSYVIRQLCHHAEIRPEDVRQLPELIEAKRTIMLVNRIIKDEKRKRITGKADQAA